MVVIVMGVTGAGKTTVGRALATSLGWEFHDGDELHSEMAKRKMHLGIALDDADRAPWLSALRQLILGIVSEERNGVVASSALKPSIESLRFRLRPEPGRSLYISPTLRAIIRRRALIVTPSPESGRASGAAWAPSTECGSWCWPATSRSISPRETVSFFDSTLELCQ